MRRNLYFRAFGMAVKSVIFSTPRTPQEAGIGGGAGSTQTPAPLGFSSRPSPIQHTTHQLGGCFVVLKHDQCPIAEQVVLHDCSSHDQLSDKTMRLCIVAYMILNPINGG